MKKTLYLLLSTLIFIFTCVGCTSEKSIEINTARAYIYHESTEAIKPTIVFQENGQFQFTYSVLSSYVPQGSYEGNDGYLFLKTDDGGYEYVFKIEDDALVFDGEQSSSIPSFSNIPDGAVFK